MQRDRDTFWQAVRGICIIAVVWIHSRSGADYADWNRDYWLISRQLINFPVAVFLFLSGYFVKPDRIGPGWLKHRAVRLLIPFYVWSFLYTVAANISQPANITDIIMMFLLGQGAGHLYFILVLAQMTLLTPLLVKAVGFRFGWLLLSVTPLYLVAIYGWAAAGGVPAWYSSLFPAWFAFYFAGLLLRTHNPEWRPNSLAMGAAVAATLALSTAEAYGLVAAGLPEALAVSQLKISSVLYAFAVIGLALAVRPALQAQPSWLIRLGDNSYGIYFVHFVWIIAVAIVTARIPALATWPILPLFQAAEITVALVLSAASIWVARKVLGARRAAAVLGF